MEEGTVSDDVGATAGDSDDSLQQSSVQVLETIDEPLTHDMAGTPPLSSLEKDKKIDFELLQDLMEVDIDPLAHYSAHTKYNKLEFCTKNRILLATSSKTQWTEQVVSFVLFIVRSRQHYQMLLIEFQASRQKAICVNRVRNLSVSQLIQLENFAAGVICFSELPSDWTLEYAVDLITERRFRRMSRHLDNARSALMRLTKIISQNTSSSSASEERRVVQDKPVEVSQGPRLQDVKPNELTSRPQMQESKHMLIARLKQQSRKLVNIAKTPSIQGEEFGDLVSTQWHQGRAPMDSNLEPGQDNQITVSSAEWKGGILSRPNKQLESGDVLSMGSDQEPKPAVRKPTELISKVQFKDTPSSELAPEPVVAHVNAQGVQYGPQVSSVKPCPMTPEPQVHQVKALEPMVEPPLQDVTTMVLSSDPQSGSTNSVQGTPRSECQREPCTGSDLRLQPQGARPKELKPSTQGRGVRSPELTVRSKVQGEKSREFHLESDLQVKTSLLAVGLQEKKFNCTSVLHPQGIRTVKLNKKPQVKSVRFSQWTPAPKFQGVTFLESNCGPPSPGVRATEEKTSIQLGGWKTPEMALGPTPQGKKSENLNLGPQELYLKTSELSPGPQPHKGENVPSTSEPQSQCVKSVALHHGPQLENTKSDPMIPLSDCQDRSSPGLSCGLQPQEGKPLGSSPGTQPRAVTPSPVKQQSQSSEEKSGAGSQRSQSLNDVELKCGKSSELALQTKPRAGTSENGSGPQWQCAKCSDLSPETASQNMNYTKLSPSSQLKGKPFTELAVGTQTRGVKLDCKPGPQWQGVKSNSFLRTKPQEMEMEDSESGPKLQDLKPSEMVMDIKVHDVMSVDFGSGPHSQGITSEVISGKRDPGMKSIDIKPRSKLQGQKHAFTPTKMVLGTKSVELDSGSRVQDLKYPELIMSMKLLGVNSMGQHVTTIKSSEVVTQDLRNKEFSPEPCFEKVTSVKVKPGSPAQSLNPLEFTPFHRSQHAKSSFAPKPCLQGTKPVQLRLGSQQLSMDCQQFPFGEKPTSDPDSKSSELTPQKRYRSPETLNLSRCMHSRSVPLTGSAMPGGARALAMKNFGSRTSDSHHSLKASCLPQAEMDISDQLHLLKDLQLQTAAKLLESQVPHNVPPPLESGLVLQYPICLQCGRCSAFKSCCKTECAFGPLISVYPQICFFRTLEGRAKMQVDLGFKLGIGERPLVGRCQRRSRAAARKHTTRQRKANTYRPASKSPTTPRDFQSPSSQAPASVQLQWGSHGVVGKMDANDSEHYEFCPRKDKTRAKGSLKKTYRVKYLLKKMKRDFILSLL
ncbi:hypothetical protein STEG23_020871 [Scotinomys teguina]